MTPTALRAPLRCPELGRACYQSLTLEPSPSLYLQEGRMEPGVLGRHRPGQEREEGLRQVQAADGGPALTTWRTDRLPSAVNLSSLEFAAPVWSRVCRRKWGSSAESCSPPRAHQGAPCPHRGELAWPGEARPQKCSRKSRLSLASQTHLQALAVSLPSDFQSEPVREAAWGACP